MKRVLLSSLKPEQRFALPECNITGRLVKSNECRAVVRLDKPETEVEFRDSTGAIKTFKVKAGGVTSWTPSVLVVPLEDDEQAPKPARVPIPVRSTSTPTVAEDLHMENGSAKPPKNIMPTPATAKPTRPSVPKPAEPKILSEPKPPTGSMSLLDAAAEILKQEGKPMHVRDIVPKMAEAGLWQSVSGKTPWKTLWVALSSGKDSRFVKAGPSIFGLK